MMYGQNGVNAKGLVYDDKLKIMGNVVNIDYVQKFTTS
jgi:hypothetical protein